MATTSQEESPINEIAIAQPELGAAEIARLTMPQAGVYEPPTLEPATADRKNHTGKRILATVAATLAIGGLAACSHETSGEPQRASTVATSAGSPTSGEATPVIESPATSLPPTDSEQPTIGSTSPTPESTAGSDGSQIDTTTLEGLAKAKPIWVEVDNVLAPFGTKDIIKQLYLDIQLADQTGDLDFLDAALGEDPTTELYTNLADNVNKFQEYFATNRAAQLNYTFRPTQIQQDGPASLTWNLVVEENNGTGLKTYGEEIILGKYPNPDGTERWIITDIGVQAAGS